MRTVPLLISVLSPSPPSLPFLPFVIQIREQGYRLSIVSSMFIFWNLGLSQVPLLKCFPEVRQHLSCDNKQFLSCDFEDLSRVCGYKTFPHIVAPHNHFIFAHSSCSRFDERLYVLLFHYWQIYHFSIYRTFSHFPRCRFIFISACLEQFSAAAHYLE